MIGFISMESIGSDGGIRLRLGYALGGGAARGLFHVGALKALAEEGLVPDILAGTSVGAMVAAAFSADLDVNRLESEILKIRWEQDVMDFNLGSINVVRRIKRFLGVGDERHAPGVLQNSRVVQTINRLVGEKRFDQLMPLILTGADIESCEQVLFCSRDLAGPLARGLASRRESSRNEAWRRIYDPAPVVAPFENVGLAARVSGCFPVAMASVPLEITDFDGTTRTRLLNDGGVLEQVPVTPLKALGCEVVIGFHLGFVPHSDAVFSVFGISANAVQGIVGPQVTRSLDAADYVIYDPRIEQVPMHVLDPALVERGYVFTREHAAHIRDLVQATGSGAHRSAAT